jgi:flagellar biogenesis protein FliO
MINVKFGDLVERMAISLVVVLGLMYVAYKVIKRRQTGPPVRARRLPTGGLLGMARSATSGRSTRSRATNTKRGLKIVARVGVSKTSSVLAVQFGERVFMLGATEQAAPTVLAEIDLAAWTSSLEEDESSLPMLRVPVAGNPAVGRPRPTSFIDALRERTARRA